MKIKTKTIALTGILSALAVVLMEIPKFSPIPAVPFLEVDFSDVPALFASVAVSPLCGVLVVFIKNLIHLLRTSTLFVGELTNFLCGTALVLPVGLFTRKLLSKWTYMKKLPLTLIIAAAIQIVVAFLVNYLVSYDLYKEFLISQYGMTKGMYMAYVVPFNLIKDLLVCIVFYLLFRLLYPRVEKLLN